MTTGFKLKLLGVFEARGASGAMIDVAAKKGRALVAYLAMPAGRAHTREKLASLLWSDRSDKQARDSLRQALTEVKRSFEVGGVAPLIVDRDLVSFDAKAVESDVGSMETLAGRADRENLRQAASLYQGELLDGIDVHDPAFEDWLRGERQRLANLAIAVQRRLLAVEAGHEAIAAAHRLLELDPLQETGHQVLMRLYGEAGDISSALKQYQICRKTLKQELGVEPSPETEDLLRRLRDHPEQFSSRLVRQGQRPEPAHGGAISAPAPPTPLLLPDKVSIAVLPFDNMSGDPEQQYFSDGITEDIIDRLSKYRILSVIGRNSSFALRGRAALTREIGEKLAADYVLTGNVRKSENRIRVAARLTDVRTEAAVWADHYDQPLRDIFAIQDEVASIIASTLMGRVEMDVATRRSAASPATISSYEHVLQGMWHFRKLIPAANTAARVCFQKAIAVYPDNAEGYRWLSACHLNAWLLEFSRHDLAQGLSLGARAVDLDPASARCHTAYALCQLWAEGAEAAEATYLKALSLNPGDPDVLIELGLLYAYRGQLAKSHGFVEQAYALNPVPPLWYPGFRAVTAFVEGRYAEALPGFAAISDGAWDAMFALSCLGHLDRREQAIDLRSRIRAAHPQWDLIGGAATEPFSEPEPRQSLISGLTIALTISGSV